MKAAVLPAREHTKCSPITHSHYKYVQHYTLALYMPIYYQNYLPVPVAAQAHISLPIKASGMVRACTEVGEVKPNNVTACV